MTAVLERRESSFPQTDIDREFAKKCSEKLGYTAMLNEVVLEPQHEKFLSVLKDLGLTPFTPKSVERYKAQKLAKALPWQEFIFKCCAAVLVIGVVGVLVSGGLAFSLWGEGWLKRLFSASAICVGAPLLTSVALVVLSENGFIDKASWEFSPIFNYGQPVPEFALQTALDLKDKLPHTHKADGFHPDRGGVELFIDWLRIRRETTSRWGDPFLVAQYAGRNYYLEVWNEPGYKQQREV